MKRTLLLFFISTWSFAQTPATALDFDGVDDYVNLGTDSAFDYTSTSTFTLEAWINSGGSASAWNVILARETYDNQSGWIFYLDNGNLYFRNTDGSPEQYVGVTLSAPTNTWVHVAVTYDNTAVSLFEDGVLVETGTVTLNSDASQSLFLGARHSNNGTGFYDAFTGIIDEVRIWDVARTPSEILEAKDCAISGAVANLVSYYDFNQGEDNADNSTETTLISSDPAYNGILNNFSLTGASSNFVDGSANGVDSCALSNSSFDLSAGIKIFPNPSNGIVYINKTHNLILNNAVVTDINGRIVSRIDISQMQSQQAIDLSAVTSGMYFVTLNTDGASITKKLFIK